MNHAVIYIHGQGGSPAEAEHYAPLFEDADVMGFPYSADTPWEAADEFPGLFHSLCGAYESVTVIANSIGAFFAMCALADQRIEKAFFISPVVDMQQLIENMMVWANVDDAALREQGTIETAFGQTLSWEYLCYVREHPVSWKVPTHILYGSRDDLTSLETVSKFAEHTGATLTVMEGGEHWFHTEEQMRFLDQWIRSFR